MRWEFCDIFLTNIPIGSVTNKHTSEDCLRGLGLKIGALLVFILTACAQEKTKEANILQIRKDGEVHYEGTNEHGEFNDHKIFKDPLADEYEEGIAFPNKLSSVQTILDNGVENRINVVMVGDGYTSSQLAQYASDAQVISDKFLDQEPFKNYKSYFSVHRVDAISSQSGVDNDAAKGIKRNTALDMSYWCNGVERLLCVNIQKVKQYAANARRVDQILAIANSVKHGGAGYWNDGVGTLAARNPNSIETAIHEFGHTFGKLGDEYDYAGSSTSECLAKANGSSATAQQMLAEKIKWFRWLDLSHINTFKGTCYSNSGYRPTANSKMRTLGLPFYEVNSEQLILSIYKKVKPIDSATPPGTYPKNRILKVTPMAPVLHSLDVRWYLNGKEILSAAQKLSFSVASLGALEGKHTITVKVTDNTSQVRDENQRSLYMTDSRSWTIE
jgi:hypothetical protein